MTRRLGIACVVLVALVLGGTAGHGVRLAAQGADPALDPDDIGGVVTDDAGRYVIPDLPDASYQVWVRGYGLVDSAKVAGTRGRRLDLRATVAPNPAAAAQYYPAASWTSLIEAPQASAFPIGDIKTQGEWVRLIKGDWIRQQYGLKPMRELHPDNPTFKALGLKTTLDVLNYMRDAGQ